MNLPSLLLHSFLDTFDLNHMMMLMLMVKKCFIDDDDDLTHSHLSACYVVQKKFNIHES